MGACKPCGSKMIGSVWQAQCSYCVGKLQFTLEMRDRGYTQRTGLVTIRELQDAQLLSYKPCPFIWLATV